MKYMIPEKYSKEEIDRMLNSKNKSEIIKALISAVNYIDDWKWVQSKLLHFINCDDLDIKGVSIISLGNLVRINRNIDKNEVSKALEVYKNHPDLQGKVEDALDDISMFVGKNKQ